MKKKKTSPQICEDLLQNIQLHNCSWAVDTDFTFSENQRYNFQMFKNIFTMCNDAGMISLEASLLGYNDNLN